MITGGKRELKSELIKLRQDPEFPSLRNLCRRTLRYIEKLEKRLEQSQRRQSHSHSN